jgi:hypothetical protein
MRRLSFAILLALAAFVAAGCFRDLDPNAFDVVHEDDAADAPEAIDEADGTDSAETDADVTPAD